MKVDINLVPSQKLLKEKENIEMKMKCLYFLFYFS